MSGVVLPAGIRVFERGWLSSNNVLLHRSQEEAALIDSGYVTHAAQTLALVEQALQGAPLRHLLNTHLHSDHCGGNAALQARHAPTTWIPAASAGAVADWDEDRLSYKATGQDCPRFVYDHVLYDGDCLQLGGGDWQVLAAPGHDPHAVMLFNAEHGILVSADALWENGFGVVFPELEGEAAFGAVRATLDRIAGLDASLVIPGHGAPFGDVRGALERAYSRLDYLASDALRHAQYAAKVLLKFKLMEARRMTLAELQGWMAGTALLQLVGRRFFDLPSQALMQTLLDALIKAGAVEVCDGWVIDIA